MKARFNKNVILKKAKQLIYNNIKKNCYNEKLYITLVFVSFSAKRSKEQ